MTLLLLLWEAGYAVYRYTRLAAGFVQYRPPEADFFVAAAFIWFFVALLRQVGRADVRLVPLWHKLWRPQGRPARAVHGFALVFLIPVWLIGVLILRNEGVLTNSVAAVLLSAGSFLPPSSPDTTINNSSPITRPCTLLPMPRAAMT